MKYLLIALGIYLWIFPVFSADIYEQVEQKLETIQEQIVDSGVSQENIITSLNNIIEKGKVYERRYPQYAEIFSYISTDTQLFLEAYKIEKGLTNTLIFSDELGEILNLQVFHREFQFEGNTYFLLRKFSQNNVEKYLIVQDASYETFIVQAESLQDLAPYSTLYNASQYKAHQDSIYQQTPNPQSPLQNNGLTHAHSHEQEGVFLTADFCPSGKHGFEKEIIEQFMAEGHKNIGIAITSSWIEGHREDYDWLLKKNNSGELNISWINHTKTHNYDHGVDFSHNFILSPGLDLEDELLDVEKQLLEKGQIPSLFMRYPGLVSDENIRRETIYTYGLIPLGANSWLAKGEHPEAGSIILIHGNKNEPYGIQLMEKILEAGKFEYDAIEEVLD